MAISTVGVAVKARLDNFIEGIGQGRKAWEQFRRVFASPFNTRSLKDLNKITAVFAGGGIVAGVGILSRRLNDAAKAWHVLNRQVADGELTTREAAAELARTIPVLGDVVKLVDTIRTGGENLELEGINKSVEAAQKLNDLTREFIGAQRMAGADGAVLSRLQAEANLVERIAKIREASTDLIASANRGVVDEAIKQAEKLRDIEIKVGIDRENAARAKADIKEFQDELERMFDEEDRTAQRINDARSLADRLGREARLEGAQGEARERIKIEQELSERLKDIERSRVQARTDSEREALNAAERSARKIRDLALQNLGRATGRGGVLDPSAFSGLAPSLGGLSARRSPVQAQANRTADASLTELHGIRRILERIERVGGLAA